MKIRGRIRTKIILVVIPILIITSGFIGLTAYFSSKNGITRIAKEFLGFQLNEIYKFAARQNATLISMQLTNDATLVKNSRNAVADYALSVMKSKTGLFVGVNRNGKIETGSDRKISDGLGRVLVNEVGDKTSGWLEFSYNGKGWVGVFIEFSDWNMKLFLLNERQAFYSNVNEIVNYLIIILGASIIISSILLLTFITRLTNPIHEFVETIRQITEKMDLTKRVRIYYPDEIGYLGFYFNNMIAELEAAYNQIKNYAYQTVLAKKKEERVRFIFQKFVPQEVINQVLNLSSDTMLIGARQKVTILFSDIRGFTTISENLSPEELVLSLNSYFDKMVKLIMNNHGTVDKFIGDAIMAIFGAPLQRQSDAANSVFTGLEMLIALDEFNAEQKKKGSVPFKIGVGINTGDAIVGNIGSEQKIDYTVIGDTVNLASRLEGLTKKYKVPILISEFTRDSIKNENYYYREVDNVRVKGKNEPVKIFYPIRAQRAEKMRDFLELYNKALYLYYKGNFQKALELFQKGSETQKDDKLCILYIERCQYLIQHPPVNWEGVETWTEK